MGTNLLVYVEHDGGTVKRTALECASKAAQLVQVDGGQVVALVLGAGAAGTAGTLARYGVDRVLVCEQSIFDNYLVDPHVALLTRVAHDEGASAILFPDTSDSRDVAAKFAMRAGSGIVAGVVELFSTDTGITARESIFGGNYLTTVFTLGHGPGVFLVRPNAFTPSETPRDAVTESLEYEAADGVERVRIEGTQAEPGAPIPLEEATTIVAGGRGLGGPEPFGMLLELAGELNGVVGASRAAVDAGWAPYAQQVGQTGRTVKPALYLAVGISGAVQHRVGMQTAGTIVAINRDGDAPIFELSDLAVVGDLFQIVPALTEELRRRKGGTD